MKSSELRVKLRELEEEHGDLDVKVNDRDMGYSDDVERVWHVEPRRIQTEHWFEISS